MVRTELLGCTCNDKANTASLAWDCSACVDAGVLPTRLWLVPAHLLPSSAKPFPQDSRGKGVLPLGSRDKGALFGDTREYLCGWEMWQPPARKAKKRL